VKLSAEYIVLITILSIPVMLVLFMIMAKIHYSMHNKILHFVLGTIFSVLNFLTNAWTISIVGLELPKWHKKEFPTTLRMKRWKKLDPDSKLNRWRIGFATKICKIVSKYDPGHC